MLMLVVCLGDRIVVVVQKQRSATSEGSSTTALANKVRRGDIRHAVVVRVKKEVQRDDGTVVRFGDNACVLVNKAGDPIGTRMNGSSKWSYLFRLSTESSLVLTRIHNKLTSFLQASWDRNCAASSGPRSCRWRPCTCKSGCAIICFFGKALFIESIFILYHISLYFSIPKQKKVTCFEKAHFPFPYLIAE